jgi:hypothetical protein
MTEEADPTALAHSRLLHKRFPQEYAVMRARCTVNLKIVPFDRDDLWSFIMLPDASPVSRLPFPFDPLRCTSVVLTDAISRG